MIQNVSSILLIRFDKIGDVTLITPAISALRKAHPRAKIVVCVKKNVQDVLAANPAIDRVIAYDDAIHSGPLGFLRLRKEFRKEKFQVLIVFQGRFRVVCAAFLSWIRFRIGPISKWWSFLFFNLGIRQNRSNVEMHEAEYNIQLLRDLGVPVLGTKEMPRCYVSQEFRDNANEFFESRGFNNRYKTVIIHPGMEGSALNWPERHYIALGKRLIKRYNVLITGGPKEEKLVEEILQKISESQTYEVDSPILGKYLGKESLAHFMGILEKSDAIVAPSTGPMHLGVALGKTVITVFPPIKVQSALRWGPYGVPFGTNLGVSPADKATVLVPDVNCAERFKCALSRCIYFPCMPRISVRDVETQLDVLLDRGEVTMLKSPNFANDEDLEFIEDDLDSLNT